MSSHEGVRRLGDSLIYMDLAISQEQTLNAGEMDANRSHIMMMVIVMTCTAFFFNKILKQTRDDEQIKPTLGTYC